MKRILVGIDGSTIGWHALARAAELARATSASLQIAHVSPQLTSALAAHDFSTVASTWQESQEAYAKGLLNEAAGRVRDAGVEVATVSREGPPAEVLAELAQAPEVTMAVVGHRGRNLAARLFIGSVADRLVQISPKPVLVVH